MDLIERLCRRGYDEQVISEAFSKAIQKHRGQLLLEEKKGEKKACGSLEYSPVASQIRDYWEILGDRRKIKHLIPPIISFRRTKNLKDKLVRGRFVEKHSKKENVHQGLSLICMKNMGEIIPPYGLQACKGFLTNGTDRHKVLLQPEPRWIFDTNALGPLGLNDRNKLSSFLM